MSNETDDGLPVVMVPVTLDSVAEVRCPDCDTIRRVEPDARYVVECETCGQHYQLRTQI